MGTFAPQSVYSNNPSPQTGAGLAALASNQEAIMELPGAQAPQSVEISDNALTFSSTPVSAYLVVDTEGQAAADDLEVINPVVSATDNLHDGMIVYLQAADAARVVTVVNSNAANGIQTVSGSNITLTVNTWCTLQLRSGIWHEISSTQPQTIDGVTFSGTAGITHATVCDTAAATAAKTASINGFVLAAGAEATVKFTNGNSAANPTLNVSGTGAAPILYQGVAVSTAAIGAGTVCRLYYDGTSWNIVGILTAPATTSSLGTARLATSAEVLAGAAVASPLPAVLDVNDIDKIPAALGGAMMYNVRTVITTSGTWTAPVTGWYKVIVIGGGGGGSKGHKMTSSVAGGGGGGGGSGHITIAYKYITAGTSITCTIGAGGLGGTTNAGTDGGATSFGDITANGGNGSVWHRDDTEQATAGGESGGAGGVPGGTGSNGGYSSCAGAGGAGGATGLGHGGGGGGGGGGHSTTSARNGTGGTASDGGTNGDTPTSGTGANGGAGGAGAVILEYFNPAVTA